MRQLTTGVRIVSPTSPPSPEVTMTSTTATRTTSAYSLRVACAPADADTLLAVLVIIVSTSRPVTDQHSDLQDPAQPYVSVSYRAAGDADAVAFADTVLAALPGAPAFCLFTGHGVHRRIVAE